MVSVSLFYTNNDINTLVNQLLDAELSGAPQMFRMLEEPLTYLRIKILLDGCKRLTVEQGHVLEEAMCF